MLELDCKIKDNLKLPRFDKLEKDMCLILGGEIFRPVGSLTNSLFIDKTTKDYIPDITDIDPEDRSMFYVPSKFCCFFAYNVNRGFKLYHSIIKGSETSRDDVQRIIDIQNRFAEEGLAFSCGPVPVEVIISGTDRSIYGYETETDLSLKDCIPGCEDISERYIFKLNLLMDRYGLTRRRLKGELRKTFNSLKCSDGTLRYIDFDPQWKVNR